MTTMALKTEIKGFLYLKYKLLPSQDGDGVKMSLTDVRAFIRLVRLRRPCGTRGRRGDSRFNTCEEINEK